METIIILPYPKENILGIENLVRRENSFVSLLSGDIYQIFQYIASDARGEFSAVIDRNFYTRITCVVRDKLPKNCDLKDYRWAAAVLAFLQIAEVKFFPSSSLQEYASINGGKSAVAEFEAFCIADDTDPKHWINFALGREDKIDASLLAPPRSTRKTPTPKEYEDLPRQFIAHQAFMLKIALLTCESSPPAQKVIRFIDWMYSDFRLGAAALLFANIFFSPSKHSKMLKGLDDRSIKNAAWDLTLIHFWRQIALEGASKNTPVLLVSRDKAMKTIASRLAAETEQEFKSFIVDVWSKKTSEGKMIFEHYLRVSEALAAQRGKRRLPTLEQTKMIVSSLRAQLDQHIARASKSCH